MFLRIPTAHTNSCRNGATSFSERAHRGRFGGKYSTFGQNGNFARILRFKEVRDPHFYLNTSPSLTNFRRLSKNGQKINVGSLFFFPFLYPHAIELCTLWSFACLEMQIFKISFTSGAFKNRIYLFNSSNQINFGNASLFPMICSWYFCTNSRGSRIEWRGPIYQNKHALSDIISSKRSRWPPFIFAFLIQVTHQL